MKFRLLDEIRNFRWFYLPFVILIILGIIFKMNCIDGWCGGVTQGIFYALGILFILVLLSFLWMRYNNIRPAIAGFASWINAFTALCLVIAYAQLYEEDYASMIIALILAAAGITAVYLMLRRTT